MENLPYLLKASIGIVAFYGFYWLVLRRHTYFTFNRFYLLTALFLSLVAPLVELPTEPLPVVEAEVLAYAISPNVVKVQNLDNVKPFDWQQLAWILYGIGVLIMSIRFVSQLVSILKIVRKSERFLVDGQTIALTPDAGVSTFSFFKWLIINPKDYEKYFDTVLSHETIHAQQGHSFDLVLAEIVQIVLWFNPVLIYCKRSLRQIHEYLADDQTDTTDRQQYAQKLFGYVFQVEAIPLTNSFLDNLTLKNRIKMLYQKRSSRWVLGRYLLVLPLLGLLITLVAARVAEPTVQVSERITVRGQVVVDTLPKPTSKRTTIIRENGMPDSGQVIRINSGNNVVWGVNSPLYIVDGKILKKEEKLKIIDPNDIITINVLKDEAAIKLYGKKATNGVIVIETKKRIKTSNIDIKPAPQPLWREDISIKVDSVWIDPSEQSNIKQIVFSPNNPKIFGGKKPIYVIDGQVVENDKDFDGLKPEDIVTMNVLKGETATKLYGEKATNGVIVIETKKAQGFTNYKLKMPDIKIKADYLNDENITYYLEDEKITEAQMKAIKPEDIATVNVKKDEKGKNSTVIITLKKKN